MKYKYLKNDETISETLFNELQHFGDREILFRMIPGVGDYFSYSGNVIKITKIHSHPDMKKTVAEFETLTGGDIGRRFAFTSIFAENLKHLTAQQATAEIDKATKKFPFEYYVDDEKFYIDSDSEKVLIHDPSDENLILLSQSAWQEIGKRKGWSL